ncbi:MAG: hypothetical protein A2452_04380 [Candidatus Firestonebacteria bacterium RIFOXYC2_FULL_39_67]|nr:MAG: hypothetical protein A2536_11275 [Candidatus Firestonebacteria bacterium RIFOXYD2_FULL_39_29]OGF54406.1 MAG: hypothetical protein A2452_04380 [Candidatus Firestonebacteria bacterium RIFOXYC2_FULL_39_67]
MKKLIILAAIFCVPFISLAQEVKPQDKEWVYVSETSAVVYFWTDEPVGSYVEYGSNKTKLDQKTEKTKMSRKGHLYILSDLKKNAVTYYRLVTILDNKETKGTDKELKTKNITKAVYIDGDSTGTIALDKADTTYVLTKDIDVSGGAFRIKAGGVTLDLGGHTVSYGSGSGIYIEKSGTNVKIINGVIKQKSEGKEHAIDIYGNNPEISGLIIETIGDSNQALSTYPNEDPMNDYTGGFIHHNKISDNSKFGIKKWDRWNYESCLYLAGPETKINYNIITGFYRLIVVVQGRGMSDTGGGEIAYNDLYLNSGTYFSDALTIEYRCAQVHHNYIFAEGISPSGIMLGGQANRKTAGTGGRYANVYSNVIKINANKEDKSLIFDSYNKFLFEMGMGITVSSGSYGHRIYDNEITVESDKYDVCGMRVVNIMFEDGDTKIYKNKITATIKGKGRAICIAATGGCVSETVIFSENILISNSCNIAVGDLKHVRPGKGEQDGCRNAKFIANTIIKLSNMPNYKTIRCGYDTIDTNAIFIDNKFEGGAGPENILWDGTGDRKLLFGKRVLVTVKNEKGTPVRGVKISTKIDNPKWEVYGGYTTVNGILEIAVIDNVISPKGKSAVPSDTIFVVAEDYEIAKVAAGTDKKTLDIVMKPGYPDPEEIIKGYREKTSDIRAPEGDWDWFHANLKTVYEEGKYEGVTSCAFYWQTDGRAWGYVEYGPDKKYGKKTLPIVKPNFGHLYHARGLSGGQTYHYRLVSTGTDGKKIMTEDKTFTTKTDKGYKKVPEDGKAEMITINAPGRYLLTKDLKAVIPESNAISINSSDVYLDLDGHNVLYGNHPAPGKISRGCDVMENSTGVTVVNGRIYEGPHDAAESHAFFLWRSSKFNIGWMHMEIRSFYTSALSMVYNCSNFEVHHNVMVDNGHEYANRHDQIRFIDLRFSGDYGKIHHNVVVGARNQAISGGGKKDMEVYDNCFELVGHSTNSACVALGNAVISRNKIIARGEHPHAAWGAAGCQYIDNKLDAMTDNCISYEYMGALGGVAFRTNYGSSDNMVCTGNTMVAWSRDDASRDFRGGNSWVFWLADINGQENVLFKNNIFVSMVYDGLTTNGLAHCSTSPNIKYEGNTVISNYRCVTFGTHRGAGRNSRWSNNTFIKLGKDPRFKTFGNEHNEKYDGNILTGSKFVGGASYDLKGLETN